MNRTRVLYSNKRGKSSTKLQTGTTRNMIAVTKNIEDDS
jgi:hypothetical protein